MKFSMEVVLVSLLNFLLFLCKTTQIWAHVEPLRSLNLHMPYLLRNKKYSDFSLLHTLQSLLDVFCSRLPSCPQSKLKEDRLFLLWFQGYQEFLPISTERSTAHLICNKSKIYLGGKRRQQSRQKSQMSQSEKVWIRNKDGWMQQDESDRVFPAKRNCTKDKLTQFDFYQFLECQTAESSTSCIFCNNRRNTPLVNVLLAFLILYKKYTRSSSSSPWAAPTVPCQCRQRCRQQLKKTATDGAMPASELTPHDSPFFSSRIWKTSLLHSAEPRAQSNAE